MATPYLYLLHFERPFHHARHYLGLAHDVASRIAEHIAGRGTRLMEVIEAWKRALRHAKKHPAPRNWWSAHA